MAEYLQGANFTSISAAATTLIVGHHTTLATLDILGTGNGTLVVYNSPTAAGTASTNQILSIPFLSVTAPNVLPMNINFPKGIVTTVTGTINAGISWV